MTEESANRGRHGALPATSLLAQEEAKGTSEKAATRALARKKSRRVSQVAATLFSCRVTREE